ncbi:hypothetical protein [Patulibacter sp.]|uniref:hypothetical protein n=1 Tax=Patulibacter sp. TaxID=1912859 RepID=UPI00271C1E6A|nr:hypothetical protein [Patulibacter sp.]MDO9410400.1 hypothetical protein [Patulibacter sp.]
MRPSRPLPVRRPSRLRPTRRPLRGRPSRLRPAAVLTALGLLAVPAVADARPTASTPGFDGSTKRLTTKAPPLPLPRRVTLATNGAAPHAVVDDAGTAYVTWRIADGGPGGEDAVGFCRLPRGAAACDNPAPTRVLVPEKAYDADDGPNLNKELSDGPFPVIVNTQLVVLTSRYPTRYALPDGSGTTDRATVLLVSLDGGTSFSSGGPAGTGVAVDAQPVAFGSASSPRIAALSSQREGGTFVQALTPGAFTAGRVDLGSPAAPGERAQLATLPGGGVAAVLVTGPGRFAVRRFDGQGDPNDASRWTVAGTFQGYAPTLAAGPGGRLFVASRPSADVGVYGVTEVGGKARGTVQPTSATVARMVGRGGALSALVLDRGDTRDAPKGHKGLYARRSASGDGVFAGEQRLTTSAAEIEDLAFDVAPDGGGFAVWTPAGSQTAGEIRGLFFGPLTRSPGAGLPTTIPGSVTGGGNVTAADCRRREFARVKAMVETGCFLTGVRDGRSVAVAEGPIRVNGLRVVPLGGTQLVIDPADKELYTAGSGSARVEIPVAGSSPIVLWEGGLRQKLVAGPGGRLFAFDVARFPVRVKGFPVVGALEPRIDGDGSSVTLALRLPTGFGDATGQATLKIDPESGLRLDSLSLQADRILVPPVSIDDLSLTWTAEGDRWVGGAKITLPGGASLRFEVIVADGKLVSVRASYVPTFPGIGLYPQVFLHRIDAGFGLSPLKLSGGAGIGVVPIAPPTSAGQSGSYLFDVDGSLTATFGSPFVLEAKGDLRILSTLDVAAARFEFSTAGYAKIAAEVGVFKQTKPFLFLGAKLDIYAGKLGAQGEAAGTACALGKCVEVGKVVVSNKGMGGCAKIPLPYWKPPFYELVEGSATYVWGDGFPEFDSGCDLRSVTIAGTRQVGGPTRLAIPAGTTRATINVGAAGTAPAVDLIDPAGRTIQPEADGDTIATAATAATGSRIVVLGDPAAGTWQVVPRAGSPAFTSVSATVPAPAPKVTAKVGRARGTTRSITYRLDAIPDETVRFVERTRRGSVVLSPGGRRGTVRFTPNALVPGRHEIEAQVLQDGIVKRVVRVGSFVQRTLRVGTPRRVTVRRRGARLEVRFRPGGAVRHAVLVRYADGARETTVVRAGRSSVRVRAPRRTVRGGRTTVSVRAIAPSGRLGRPARATLRR